MSSKNEALFGEIRSILQQNPSEEAWTKLSAQLTKCVDDEYLTDVILPYVAEYLEKWPESVKRIAPGAWVAPMLKKGGSIQPQIALANGLEMRNSRVGPKAAQKIFAAPELAHLVHLDLSSNGLKSEGAKYFAASPHFRNLKTLILRDCKIGDSGAVAMAASDNLKNLVQLDMTGSSMTSDGCYALQHSTKLAEPLRAKAYDWMDEEREHYANGWE